MKVNQDSYKSCCSSSPEHNISVWSAKLTHFTESDILQTSFMYKINSIGSKNDPCVTPQAMFRTRAYADKRMTTNDKYFCLGFSHGRVKEGLKKLTVN